MTPRDPQASPCFCLCPCGMTAVWVQLARSAGEVQHSRHESLSQGHLFAPSDKRQLSPAALSATLLQGSNEKRGQHGALYQVFITIWVYLRVCSPFCLYQYILCFYLCLTWASSCVTLWNVAVVLLLEFFLSTSLLLILCFSYLVCTL